MEFIDSKIIKRYQGNKTKYKQVPASNQSLTAGKAKPWLYCMLHDTSVSGDYTKVRKLRLLGDVLVLCVCLHHSFLLSTAVEFYWLPYSVVCTLSLEVLVDTKRAHAVLSVPCSYSLSTSSSSSLLCYITILTENSTPLNTHADKSYISSSNLVMIIIMDLNHCGHVVTCEKVNHHTEESVFPFLCMRNLWLGPVFWPPSTEQFSWSLEIQSWTLIARHQDAHW